MLTLFGSLSDCIFLDKIKDENTMTSRTSFIHSGGGNGFIFRPFFMHLPHLISTIHIDLCHILHKNPLCLVFFNLKIRLPSFFVSG